MPSELPLLLRADLAVVVAGGGLSPPPPEGSARRPVGDHPALPGLRLAPGSSGSAAWAPAFRYPLVFLPLLALLLIPILDQRWRWPLRTLIAALGAVTLIFSLLWVVFPGWTYNFADGRTHLLDEASVRLGSDVARFFPSTVRPRGATVWWAAGSLLLVPLGGMVEAGGGKASAGDAGLGSVGGARAAVSLGPREPGSADSDGALRRQLRRSAVRHRLPRAMGASTADLCRRLALAGSQRGV